MELICGDDVRGTRITRREETLTTTRGDGEFSADWRWFYGEWKSKEITLERFRNRSRYLENPKGKHRHITKMGMCVAGKTRVVRIVGGVETPAGVGNRECYH